MNVRRAYSLLEMMVVIVASGMLLPIVVTTMAMLYHVDFAVHSDLAAGDALFHLEQQLRSDVYAAIEVNASGPDLSLTLPGGKHILWTVNSTEMSRDVLSHGEVTHRDAWPLPHGYEPVWLNETQAGIRTVTLHAERKASEASNGNGSPPRHIRFACMIRHATTDDEQLP